MNSIKKIFIILIIVFILLGTCLIIVFNIFKRTHSNDVVYNGFLHLDENALENRFGEKITLKGLSSSGLQWQTSECIDEDVLKYLHNNWKINVFRLAMYTEEDGYIEHKEEIYNKLEKLIDDCISAGIYVVVDWHNNNDGNPNKYKEEAKEFFEKVSKQYSSTPNVIYEICNEPHDVSWYNEVYNYAGEIIPIIRNNSPKSMIIVGTSNYSRDVVTASNSRLKYDNVLYSFHFYAGTHGDAERKHINYAMERKLPIIVSEWGTTDYTGDGENNFEESNNWLNYLEENEISWINWSYSYGDATSSILDKNIKNNIYEIENNLTETGKYIRSRLTQ